MQKYGIKVGRIKKYDINVSLDKKQKLQFRIYTPYLPLAIGGPRSAPPPQALNTTRYSKPAISGNDNVKKATLSTMLVAPTVIFLGIWYSAKTVFSERNDYEKPSLEYFLLTPKVLSQLSKNCEEKPKFIYRAADGPKPIITQMFCHIDKNVVFTYLSENGFQNRHQKLFEKDSVDIDLKLAKNNVEIVTVYEH